MAILNDKKVMLMALKGDKGEKGDKGDKGEAGATGAKIVSTVLEGQDAQGGNIYRQTFDDGSTTTFVAPRGSSGDDGGLTEEEKAKVDKLIIDGEGDKFLSNNGEYKEVVSGGLTEEELVEKGFVKNTNYPTNKIGGVIKVSADRGFGVNTDGFLQYVGATNTEIDNQKSVNHPLFPSQISRFVKVGLTTNKETLTDEQKAKAQEWLGLNKNTNRINALYNGLVQKEIFAVAEDVTLTKETQTTGGSEVEGLTIVDNSYATVKKISGDTVAISTNDIRNFKISGIKSVGRNLIEYPYQDHLGNIKFPYTEAGITFTENNGVVILNGTCTQGELWFRLTPRIKVNGGETLSISGCPIGGNHGKYKFQVNFWDENDNRYGSIVDIGNGGTGIVTNKGYMIVFIAIYAGVTVDNVQFKPMLSRTETALPYEPYIESVMNLPQTVELGKWDYIKDGKLYKHTKIEELKNRVFNATYIQGQSTYRYHTRLFGGEGECIVSGLELLGNNASEGYNNDNVGYYYSDFADGIGLFIKTNHATVDELNSYINDNQLLVAYRTKEPISITDLNFDNQYQVWDKGQETILSPNDENGKNSFDTIEATRFYTLTDSGFGSQAYDGALHFVENGVFFNSPYHISGTLEYEGKTYNVDTDIVNGSGKQEVADNLWFLFRFWEDTGYGEGRFSAIGVSASSDGEFPIENPNTPSGSLTALVKEDVKGLSPTIENDYYVLVGGAE